jgi:hypothetical protein
MGELLTGVIVPPDAVAECTATDPASVCDDPSCGGDLASYAAAVGESVCQAVATGGCDAVGATMTSCQCLLFSALTGGGAWVLGTALGIPESDLCLCIARNAQPLLADGSTDTLLVAAPICGLVAAPTEGAGAGRSPARSARSGPAGLASPPAPGSVEAEVAALVTGVAAGRAPSPADAARVQAAVAKAKAKAG